MEKPKDDLDAVRIVTATLESFDKEARERIFRWAAEKLGMHSFSTTSSISTPGLAKTQQIDKSIQRTQASHPDLKSFVEEKNPKSDMHFAATVAYYFLHESDPEDRKETVNRDVLVEAVRIVKWRQGLNNPGQTLLNAFNAGLLDRTSERGEYKLNMVGQNLVGLLLPDGGSIPIKKKAQGRNRKPKLQKASKTRANISRPKTKNKAPRKK